jgi:hypothetical protein
MVTERTLTLLPGIEALRRFVSSFRLDKLPDRPLDESFVFEIDEKALAEAQRKEAMQPDDELIRQRTAKPKVLEIRWTNRKCVAP